MADTSTYKGMWDRYVELREEFEMMCKDARDDDSTLAQYAGSEKLSKIVEELDSLLASSSSLRNDADCRRIQSAVISFLCPVEKALADACLFECDSAAPFEDYCSRPFPVPIIIPI